MSTWEDIAALYRGEGIGRVLMNRAIAEAVRPSGLTIDVGGRGHPSYIGRIQAGPGSRLLVMDLISAPSVDVVGSVTNLPVASASCDQVLCFNVLEHVFRYDLALAELRRILRPGATLYGRVPFLIGVHADPFDYWRYTGQTLLQLLARAGFAEVKVTPQGGLFLVILNLAWPVLRVGPLRLIASALLVTLDRVFAAVIGKRQNAERYPLGYFFEAR